MNYQQHYDRLISRAVGRQRDFAEHLEQHHVVPKCLGGSDIMGNLVWLTPEEHFTAHQLLVKINPGHKGLAWAALKMCGNPHGQRSNKMYGWLRKRHSKATSQRMIGNKINAGRKQSEEEKRKRSVSLKGVAKSVEHNKNVGIALKSSQAFREYHERKKAANAIKRHEKAMQKEMEKLLRPPKIAWNKGLTKSDHPGLKGNTKPNNPEAFAAMWKTRKEQSHAL